jgi:hypothetical protein
MGHGFKLIKPVSVDYICDLCNMSAALCDAGMYDDPECNFGVCEVCYDDLPETLKDKEK